MDVTNVSQGRHTTFQVNANSIDNASVEAIDNSNGEVKVIENNGPVNKETVKEQDVKKAVDKLNKLLEGKQTYVQYEVYGKLKSITIKIMDSNTKKVVKEIPPKKLIDMVDKLCEMAGMFMDQKA